MLFAICAAAMLAPLLIVVSLDREVFDRHTAIFFEALRLSGISKEKACVWQQIDKNQFRRQSEEMEGHISFTRMMLLPPVFFQWYAVLLAEEFGVPKVLTRSVRVLLAVRSRRQLRMEPLSAQRTA